MKHFTLPATLLVTALLAAGCSEAPSPVHPSEPLFAKPGSGTTETDPTAAFYIPTSQGNLGLWGDGLFASLDGYTGTSRYGERDCGVNSKIFATTEASNSGDAIMHTSNNRYSDKKCTDYPRKANISYANPVDGLNPGGSQNIEVFMNVNRIHNTTYHIPIGTTVKRALLIDPNTTGRCEQVRFRDPLADGTSTGADSVYVTRLDAQTWKVETRDTTVDGVTVKRDKAYCTTDKKLYHIPVSFHIRASRPLTP